MMGLMAIGILSQGGGYTGPTEWIYPTAGVYEFTVPVSGTYALELWGGGGGGANGANTGRLGGGGGAGALVTGSQFLEKGAVISITVGAAGAIGGNGGTSSFGVLASAIGGNAGAVATSNNRAGNGGASGNGYAGGAGKQGTSKWYTSSDSWTTVYQMASGGGGGTTEKGGDALVQAGTGTPGSLAISSGGGYANWEVMGRNGGGGGAAWNDKKGKDYITQDFSVEQGKGAPGGGSGARNDGGYYYSATPATAPGGGGGGGVRASSSGVASAGYAGQVKINLL